MTSSGLNSQLSLLRSFRKITWTVPQLQLLFPQFGIRDLDIHLSIASVMGFVRGGIGDQILRTKFLLDLSESCSQIVFPLGKERAAAGTLGDVIECALIHAF